MLLKPNIKLKRITDITPALLKSRSITGLILDVDNTLSTHHGQKLTEGLRQALACSDERQRNSPCHSFKLKGKKGEAVCGKNKFALRELRTEAAAL